MDNAGRRRLLTGMVAVAGSGVVARSAAAAPVGVCGTSPPPAYPAPDKSALVQSWLDGGHQDGPLPDCQGLRGRDFALVVRLTASFAWPGEMADMLSRLGAVSALKGMPYWSFSDRKRLTLIQEAFAIDKPGSIRPRPDFSAGELRSGSELYFAHSDNRSTALVPFSLQLVQLGPDKLLLRVENVGDIRYMGLTMVAVRDMQWAVALERLAPGRWGYRSLLSIHKLALLGSGEQHRLSNLSRCVAMFDLLAGRQTDIEAYR